MRTTEKLIFISVFAVVGFALLAKNALTYSYPDPATETKRGGVYLATNAETEGLSNSTDPIVPSKMAYIRSSEAETLTGAATNRWISAYTNEYHYQQHKDTTFTITNAESSTDNWFPPSQLYTVMRSMIAGISTYTLTDQGNTAWTTWLTTTANETSFYSLTALTDGTATCAVSFRMTGLIDYSFGGSANVYHRSFMLQGENLQYQITSCTGGDTVDLTVKAQIVTRFN